MLPQIDAAPGRNHLTDSGRSFRCGKRRPFINGEVVERGIQIDFAPGNCGAVKAADQALPHRVRFELPPHIPAGEDHATLKHGHHGAGVKTVGALADRPQGLSVEPRLPDVGVLHPGARGRRSCGARSRREFRSRRSARDDGEEEGQQGRVHSG